MLIPSMVERQVEFENVDALFAKDAEQRLVEFDRRRAARSLSGSIWRALATRGTWKRAAAGVMSGSRPLAEVVTRSTGIGVPGFSLASLAASPLTRSISAWLVGPRFEPPELSAACRARDGFGRILRVGLGRRRWPAVEIFVAGEVLADQTRADNLAVLLDQAAIRLMRKNELARARSSPSG